MTTSAVEAPPRGRARPASPFRGLTPYTEEDSAFFFGRDEQIEVVIANLEARPLTLLYGESGVGKSSLLQAGVVHRLRQSARRNLQEIGTPEFVPVYFASWRDDPLAALLEAIRGAVSDVIGAPAHEPPSSRRLDEALELWTAQAQADILLVLDQFEEYFLYHALERGEGTFAGQLPGAVNNPRLRARFVLSIREDALAKLDRFKREIPSLFGTFLRIRHLNRDSAEEAIRRPIEEYNRMTDAVDEHVEIEDGFVKPVLDQVTAGRVGLEQAGLGAGGDGATTGEERIETPYLQLVMTRLWNEEMKQGSRRLRLSTLEALGGAETIVRTHLDEALGALPPDVQDAVADLFHYLVTPTGTKIAYAAPDLAAYTGRADAEVGTVLERLAAGEARILRPVAASPGEEGPPRYEIFHDVLGPAVLDWRTRHVRRQLERDKDQAEELAGRERRRARIYRGLAVGAFALLIGATTVFAIVQTARANSARHRDESRRLAAESRDVLDGSLDTAILRAVQADAVANTFEARSALLAAVRRSAGLRRFLHFRSAVSAMALDPADGKLAVVLRNGTLALRDRAGQRLDSLHESPGSLRNVAFSPGGRLLAVVRSGKVFVLKLGVEGQKASLPPLERARKLRASEETFSGLTFSSNGKWLAGSTDYGAGLVWNLQGRSNRPTRRFGGNVLAFSPTSPNLLAVGSYERVELWALGRRARLLRRYQRSGSGGINVIAFSPNGRLLAAGGEDGVVRLWRVARRRRVRSFRGETGAVLTLAFADGGILAGGGDNRVVHLWDTSTGRQISEPVRGHNNVITSLAFNRQTKTLAVASLDAKVSLWDVAERARIADRTTLRGADGPLSDVAFSHDGTLLVADGGGRVLMQRSADPTTTARVLDLDRSVSKIAISSTGRWLAGLGNGPGLWDLRGKKPKPRPLPSKISRAYFEAYDPYAREIAFSRNGTLVAATSDGPIFWRPDHHTKIVKLRVKRHGRYAPQSPTIALSPDGTRLAAGYWDFSGSGSVMIWDVPQTQRSTTRSSKPMMMPGGHLRPVYAVTFSPDGRMLASAGRDYTIKLWDVEQHRLLDTLFGHTRYVTGLAFSSDGTTLASSSEDKTVRLWDVKERRALGEPLKAGGQVNAVAFSPAANGTGSSILAAAVEHGELDLWRAKLWSLGTKEDVGRLRLRLCRSAGGDLSRDAQASQVSKGLREACGWS